MSDKKALIMIKGEPFDCGAELVLQVCGPAMRSATEHDATTAAQIAEMGAGMVTGVLAVIAANLGPEAALLIGRTVVEGAEKAEAVREVAGKSAAEFLQRMREAR